jgi:hypothetical protein
MPTRLLALSFALFVVVACGSSGGNITCPTTAQSITFTAGGGCSGSADSGVLTISTQPGLCTLTVAGGTALGYDDFQGQFNGGATSYDLTMGQWHLFVNEGDIEDGSTTIMCDQTLSSTGVVSMLCTVNQCQAADCSGSGSCSYSMCMETLTPKT